MEEIKQPLYSKHLQHPVCIVDKGYSWLQLLPLHELFAVTAMFNEQGEIVQWYIDITSENGIDEFGPYMIDNYLDIIVLPTGEIYEKDHDELQDALDNGEISQEQYTMAYEQFNKFLTAIKVNEFHYLELAVNYFNAYLETKKESQII